MSHRASYLIVVALAVLLCSCERKAPSPTPSTAIKAPRQAEVAANQPPLVVSVAASTREAVETLCDRFSKEQGIEIRINSGPSSTLTAQILHGAPADVFLSANEQWADEISKAGKAEAIHPLLTNSLVLVAPQGNPANLVRPEDLLSEKVTSIALAGEKVPAGIYAEQALRSLGIFDPLVENGKIVRGQDVRSALSYVERGEAEAGVVYATDVRVAPALSVIHEFDPAAHDRIVYVLVLLRNDSTEKYARKLYQFLRSAEAMTVYEEFGFSPLDASAPQTAPTLQ